MDMTNLQVSKPNFKCKKVITLCRQCKKTVKTETTDEYLERVGHLFRDTREAFKTKDEHNLYIVCDECEILNEIKEIKENNIRLLPKKYKTIKCTKTVQLDHMQKSLFIYGDVGTGKTVYISEILKNMKTPVKWINYAEFIMRLQANYETAFKTAEYVASFENALFIDDFGAERLTDYVRQITYYIINHREQNNLQTYITSNFSLGQIDSMVDSRVSSRIAGMSQVLKFSGKDWRVENANK